MEGGIQLTDINPNQKAPQRISRGLTLAVLVMALGLPAAHAGPTNAELITSLFLDYALYDENCRGGAGNENETWMACGSRDYASAMLNKFGWCHGKEGELAYQMNWHECTPTSYGYKTSYQFK